MPPRTRWPRSAPASVAADRALVSAVLAVIDRIGELVQAIETGEIARQRGRRAADRRALRRGRGPRCSREAPAAAERDGKKAGPLDPPVRRSARPDDERRLRHGAGPQRACPAAARRCRATSPSRRRSSASLSVIAEMRDAITRTRMQRIDSLFAGLPRMVRDLSAELGKQVRLRDRRRRRRAGPRDDRDDPRSADPHRPQRDRPWHRGARGARARPASREIGIAQGLGAPGGQPDHRSRSPTTAAASTATRWSARRMAVGPARPPSRPSKLSAAQKHGPGLRAGPLDRRRGHRHFRPRRRHGRGPRQYRADRRRRRRRQHGRARACSSRSACR